MAQRKKQSVLDGALVLLVSTVLVKVIGLIYKLPLTDLIGATGRGYFSTAYNIYTPLYAISMAGLPVAVSKLVSENMALGRFKDVRNIYKVAVRAFFLTGTLGTALLLALAYPYAYYVAETPQALPCILMIAPSILFCCLMSAYRGYYEGQRTMVPTAVSQVIEAVAKMILGLLAAYAVMQYGLAQYRETGMVLRTAAGSEQEAMSLLYPYAAAASVVGVTAGTVAGLLYLYINHKVRRYGITKAELAAAPPPRSRRQLRHALVAIAVPVVVGSLINNVTNLIDTATIQNRLAFAIESDTAGMLQTMYQYSLSVSETMPQDVATYLYGVYNSALDFRNLIPTITLSLGVSAIPVLSEAWALKKHKDIQKTIESVIRVTMLIALPAGFGMGVLAEPILALIYAKNHPDIVAAAAPIVRIFGYSTALIAVSAPVTSMLQALGRADIPMKAVVVGALSKTIANYMLVGDPGVNIKGAPYASILCYLIIVGYDLFYLLRITGARIRLGSVLLRPLLAALLCSAAAWAGYGLLTHSLSGSVATMGAILIAGVVYLISLFLCRGISKEDVLMLPKGEKIAKVLEKYHAIG